MIKIILHGCNGHMGRMVSETAAEDPDVEIAAGVDQNAEKTFGYPVYGSLEELTDLKADVLIDFSTAKAVDEVISFALRTKIPSVVCTTGITLEQQQALEDAAKTAPILRSANMALGVNLVMKLAAQAAKVLAKNGYDIEIVEAHHRRKVDAPSGTAIAIADSINAECGDRYHYVYQRTDRRESRDANEIGISSIRGGTIPGRHDVIYAGDDEVITISHSAYSRKIWARGALTAAKFLAGKPAGYYTMDDVLGDALK